MAKELTIKERLTNLYRLQALDSKIDEIQVLKGELPIEVSDLEDDIAGLDKRKERIEEAIADLEHEQAKHTANIKEAETLILKYEEQLDNVKNNREYDALTKEIDLQKLEIQLSQKKMAEANQTIETKKETLANVQEKIETKNKDLKRKQEELEKIITKTDKEEKKLQKEIDKQRKKIDDRLLKAYDKIRTTYRNGLAVVPVERDACGGCFNKIPPQVQLEIGMHKKVLACEHCGRVLVDEEIVEKETAEV
ncbi:MAG: C4-type zinc ribbon domain-containing protein [Saprospiraceae bacterium]|nr:C4-type zinc ribbon domain-containing protein [Saprospiraceae bacterium]